MRICDTHKIPCPYVLKAWDELPCAASQEECDAWRKKWEEAPEEDKKKVKITED